MLVHGGFLVAHGLRFAVILFYSLSSLLRSVFASRFISSSRIISANTLSHGGTFFFGVPFALFSVGFLGIISDAVFFLGSACCRVSSFSSSVILSHRVLIYCFELSNPCAFKRANAWASSNCFCSAVSIDATDVCEIEGGSHCEGSAVLAKKVGTGVVGGVLVLWIL